MLVQTIIAAWLILLLAIYAWGRHLPVTRISNDVWLFFRTPLGRGLFIGLLIGIGLLAWLLFELLGSGRELMERFG